MHVVKSERSTEEKKSKDVLFINQVIYMHVLGTIFKKTFQIFRLFDYLIFFQFFLKMARSTARSRQKIIARSLTQFSLTEYFFGSLIRSSKT